MKLISFVVPLYNAERSLPLLTTQLFQAIPGKEIEIIYVNDGSTDTTDAIVRDLAAKESRIKYIKLAGNFGQHNAILTGLTYARGDAVVCLDDDLQTPPEESIRLLGALRTQRVDVVYGQYETNEDALRRIGTRLHNVMAQLFGKPKGVTLTSFFCMRRGVARMVSRYKGTLVYLPGLVLRATGRISSVLVRHESRKYGRSGYTIFRLIKLWLIGVLVYLHLSDLFSRQPPARIESTVNIP